MKISLRWGNKAKSSPAMLVMEECLSKEEADKLRLVNFERLVEMETEGRIDFLSKLFGEDKARLVNSRMEINFILKNQKEGLMNWVDGTADIAPKWRAEIVREISKLGKALSKTEMDSFVERLAKLKLGAGVTLEEAQRIVDLCKKIEETKLKMESGGSVADYEKAHQDLEDYKASIIETS